MDTVPLVSNWSVLATLFGIYVAIAWLGLPRLHVKEFTLLGYPYFQERLLHIPPEMLRDRKGIPTVIKPALRGTPLVVTPWRRKGYILLRPTGKRWEYKCLSSNNSILDIDHYPIHLTVEFGGLVSPWHVEVIHSYSRMDASLFCFQKLLIGAPWKS